MLALAVALAVAVTGTASPQDQPVVTPAGPQPAVETVAPASPPVMAPLLPAGTPVRLMVLKEINSRTARLGDRFKLRVDEPIYINGAPVVPVGSTAWGQIARLIHQKCPEGLAGVA